MSLLSLDLETAPLTMAIATLDRELTLRLEGACHETADTIVSDAEVRLGRALGHPSQVEAEIHAIPVGDHVSWIVRVDDPRMPNLPLWLEKGTKPGHRRNHASTRDFPYFYAAVAVQEGPHARRLEAAVLGAAQASGMNE